MVLGAGVPKPCYSAALGYPLAHADHDVALVHGLVVERGRLWPHAWCEADDTIVYDPAVGELLDREDFYRVLQPKTFDSFTPAQAACLAIATNSAGPWPPREPGAHGLVIDEAATALLGSYAIAHPDVLAWVQAMRERDSRLGDDLGGPWSATR